MDPTHQFRVFLDWEAHEFLKSLPKKDRAPLEDFLRALTRSGLPDPDYTVLDEVGRTIDYCKVGKFMVRLWRDDADNHLKILDIRRHD